MQKTINKKDYNTETATLIKKYTHSYFGDPSGFEETLYQTPDGLYFLYVKGGESSPYPKEDILRMGKARANDWMQNHNSIQGP